MRFWLATHQHDAVTRTTVASPAALRRLSIDDALGIRSDAPAASSRSGHLGLCNLRMNWPVVLPMSCDAARITHRPPAGATILVSPHHLRESRQTRSGRHGGKQRSRMLLVGAHDRPTQSSRSLLHRVMFGDPVRGDMQTPGGNRGQSRVVQKPLVRDGDGTDPL